MDGVGEDIDECHYHADVTHHPSIRFNLFFYDLSFQINIMRGQCWRDGQRSRVREIYSHIVKVLFDKKSIGSNIH